MPTSLAQLGAIIHYEFRMQWRRRTTLAIMLPLAIVPLLYGLLFRDINPDIPLLPSPTAAQALQRDVSTAMTFSWLMFYIVLAVALPIAVADVMPKDRQIGTLEILSSLPLSHAVYLSGKLISVWSVALVSLLLMSVLNALATQLVVGAVDLGALLQMLLFGAVPLLIMNSGLAMLLAARQSTRRRAVFVAAAFVIVSVMMLLPGLDTIGFRAGGAITFVEGMSLGRAGLFYHYSLGAEGGFFGLSEIMDIPNTAQSAQWTIIGGLLQVVVVGVAVWQWMRWRDG